APLERGGRHAEARRHADSVDARKLPQMRTLSAHKGQVRLVDFGKVQHVAAHVLPPSTTARALLAGSVAQSQAALATRGRGCLTRVDDTLDRCTVPQCRGTVAVISAHPPADLEAKLLVQCSRTGVFFANFETGGPKTG